jgi:autotransporter-associated beta strand protein
VGTPLATTATTFSGTIQDGTAAVGLTKTGASTLTLSGANTYSGATNVNGGTLLVTNGTGSGTGSGPVILANNSLLTGGTLTGRGGVAGAVTVGGTATISAGVVGTPAILSVGALTLTSGSTLSLELNSPTVRGTGYGALNVGGAVAVDGILNITGTYTPGSGDIFYILDNTSNSTTTGTFASTAGLPAGYTVVYGANYEGNSLTGGNDIAIADSSLAPVPEPSTVAMGLGLVGLIGWRERKRFSRGEVLPSGAMSA